MRISNVIPRADYVVEIISEEGTSGFFDVKPYLDLEAFSSLKDQQLFKNVSHGKYFIEWGNGADLSADTIEAHLQTVC
ncbi:MAG: DUF2442 domain-containing protein [Bacteroidales bacterium]|nr:DUF2442 domain-containing protein [Bacteroidales bacterium]MCF8458604.1 DUF2442 domain-containing protein [Bacteroidales bacterium]